SFGCSRDNTINVNVSPYEEENGWRETQAKVIKAPSERDMSETEIVLVKRFSVVLRFFVFNYVALELRAPLSRDKRQATDDSSKKATAAPDPVARRPFRMIARFYVFISGSRRARFSPRRHFCFSIANRNSFRSHFVYLCGERER
ncbi:hypothetical protein ALC56_03729, partial [Trachymyrmex septentrionalis]